MFRPVRLSSAGSTYVNVILDARGVGALGNNDKTPLEFMADKNLAWSLPMGLGNLLDTGHFQGVGILAAEIMKTNCEKDIYIP